LECDEKAVHVYYLNMARRPERNEQFLKWNASVAGVERVEAADGSSLRIEDLVRDGMIQEPLKTYTAGGYGCALSHKRMWERAVAEQTVVTVAEDDAVLNRRFAEKAEALLARLRPDWDIVLWGWNFDAILNIEIIEGMRRTVMRSDRRRLGAKMCEFQEKDYDVRPFRLIAAFGTICYSVSPKGAEQLLRLCFPLKNERVVVPGMRGTLPNAGIDVVMIQHYRTLKSYVSLPPLVWTDNDKSTSDIHPKRSWLARTGLWLYGMIWRG
jgi:GR25 family glycosyltransferase involved in LPS biosynthesis